MLRGQENTVFHLVINKIKIIFYVTETLLYHSIIPIRKKMKSNLCMYTSTT